MSDEAKQDVPAGAESDSSKSLRTAIVFSSIVLWIMAIFMINILYSMNAKLASLEQMIPGIMSVASSQPLENYQIMDAEGKEVLNTFRLDPAVSADLGACGESCPEGEAGMMPTGEPMGSGSK